MEEISIASILRNIKNKRSNNVSRENIYRYFMSMMKQNNIDVRNEDISSIDGSYRGRVILSYNRDNHIMNQLQTECNGLILDGQEWIILVYPPARINYRASSYDIDMSLRERTHEIFKMEDGTTFNIYRWNDGKTPIWCIGTMNAFDVTNYKWMGDKTYAENIFQVASKYPEFVESSGLELLDDGRLFFNNLNPDRCYSFGFRIHDFHPLINDPEKIWYVQTFDKETRRVIHDNIFNVPVQTQVPIMDITTENHKYARIMREKCHDHWLNYSRFSSSEYIHYGYIIKDKRAHARNPHSIMIIESEMYANIKSIIYNVDDVCTDNDNRMEIQVLRAFLNPAKHDMYVKLYPHNTSYFKKYESFINDIIYVLSEVDEGNRKLYNSYDRNMKILIDALYEHVSRYLREVYNKESRYTLLKGFLMNEDNAVMFIKALNTIKKQ